jgi:uncharacterized membrane protein YtjA (UPF0391 family)
MMIPARPFAGGNAGVLQTPIDNSPIHSALGHEGADMGNLLHYAVAFLVVALLAGFLGFGGVAGTAMEGARLLFWVAIVLFVVSAILGVIRRV